MSGAEAYTIPVWNFVLGASVLHAYVQKSKCRSHPERSGI